MLLRLWNILMSYLAMKDAIDLPDNEYQYMLGDITIKYEVGVPKPGIIVNNPADPGGKSYGAFQLSLNKGTLAKFIAFSHFSVFFKGVPVGSNNFDRVWLDIAKNYPREFLAEQREFIHKRYFMPVQHYANQQGFNTDEIAIREALFSIGVQHAGYKKIIRRARAFKVIDGSVKDQIISLYAARVEYVQQLTSLSDHIKSAIYSRYENEQQDILALYESSKS